MKSKNSFYAMAGLVALLIVGNISAVYFGDLLLTKKSESLMSVKLESRVLDEQQISIKQAKKDIEKYQGLEKIAGSIVPQDKDQAEAVREIIKIAGDNGITISTISFPASTLGQIAPKVIKTDGAATATKPIAPGITQTTAVEGIKGVFSLQINVQQDTSKAITYDRLIGFLSALEQNRRTAQVTNVAVTPNPTDRNKLTFNLTLLTYIKP